MGRNRVILVDRHSLVRHRIQALASKLEDLEVVKETDESPELFHQIFIERPDLLILTVRQPTDMHLRMISDVAGLHPPIKILIASPRTDSLFFRRALQAGASGYALTHASDLELLRAIRVVVQGAISLPLEMAHRIETVSQ
jgi:DNA-binding NarL/FixJ family response regulator